ncbi:MAG: hypothetical protein MH208_09810 [Marinobacter sp.]|nr:hypothetical protein [Marinobacter sp.]
MTVNNKHLIGKVLKLCGGVNVFGDMQRLIPRISAEVVLQADPDAILTGSVDGVSDDQLDEWKKVCGADRGGKKQSAFRAGFAYFPAYAEVA